MEDSNEFLELLRVSMNSWRKKKKSGEDEKKSSSNWRILAYKQSNSSEIEVNNVIWKRVEKRIG